MFTGAPGSDGWDMASPSKLALNGAAYTAWRTPGKGAIAFSFPCESLIFFE